MSRQKQESCLAKIGDDWEKAEFVGVYQYSFTHGDSMMFGGPKAGQVSYPVAVVRFGGKFHQLDISSIKFFEVSNETK